MKTRSEKLKEIRDAVNKLSELVLEGCGDWDIDVSLNHDLPLIEFIFRNLERDIKIAESYESVYDD